MMDGMMLVRGGRSTSASSAERSLLLGALATHMGVLDARENDAQTIIRKSELWDEITRHFNANTSAPRSRQQIQTLYKNMKAKARRYEARLGEVASGVPPPDPDPISEMLLGLLHQQMQHQQRHLQRLVATDTHTLPDNSELFKFNHHYDSTFVTPEQVMQVSLKEGFTNEMEIKNEPRDDDLGSPEDLPDRESSATDLFPDSIFASQRCQSSPVMSEPLSSSHSQSHQEPVISIPVIPHSLTVTEVSPTPTVLHKQDSTTTPSTIYQNPSSLTGQCSPPPDSHTPLSKVGAPHTSSHTGSPGNAFFHPSFASSVDAMTEELPQAAKKPKLQDVREPLRQGGYGMVPTRVPSFCCCPDLHAKLLTLAREDHSFRMSMLKEDSEMRTKEHAARMRILSLEEEIVMAKLRTASDRNKGDGTPQDEARG
ncbi:uncharacterized protein LOC121864045 [Homarus americanus]|uniref:Regulatory protein zeste n=1 Tax=Homarus americanus TaxID=6706 RepID=A0A8J5KEE2_HOMAM|nr:uncharacterized protein LOC121864045 [Homarus americanus]KAG7170793.1 putative Myb/SANT-like DNA-binding domain-containing protein 5 [Homarus americanus]